MALDFPNTPTLNQVFTAPNGAMWMWDGAKWTAIASVSQYAANNNVGRNLIHNPLFNVAQRGAGPWGVSGYTADRWALTNIGNTAGCSIVALSDGNRTAIGDETAQFGLQTVIAAVAGAGNNTRHTQSIENVRRLAGKTVTVSFWAWASAALNIGVSWLISILFLGRADQPR